MDQHYKALRDMRHIIDCVYNEIIYLMELYLPRLFAFVE